MKTLPVSLAVAPSRASGAEGSTDGWTVSAGHGASSGAPWPLGASEATDPEGTDPEATDPEATDQEGVGHGLGDSHAHESRKRRTQLRT